MAGPFLHAGSLAPHLCFFVQPTQDLVSVAQVGRRLFSLTSSPVLGIPELARELEATEKNRESMEESKRGVRCLLDGKPSKGGSNRRLQEGLGHAHTQKQLLTRW